MQKSNSSFYATAAVLIAVASFLYAWKFITPHYQKNLEDMAKTEKEIELSKDKLESLQKTKNSLDQLGEVVNRLFLAIPSDKDSANLITELEATAAKEKISIPSIQISDLAATPAAPGIASSQNTVGVAFTVNGSFDELSKFITDLEKDIRFTNIKTLTYQYAPDKNITSLALQLEVYRRSSVASPATNNNTAAAKTEVK